jgi:hypothetical protein
MVNWYIVCGDTEFGAFAAMQVIADIDVNVDPALFAINQKPRGFHQNKNLGKGYCICGLGELE